MPTKVKPPPPISKDARRVLDDDDEVVAWDRTMVEVKVSDLFGFKAKTPEGKDLMQPMYLNTPPREWWAVKPDSGSFEFPRVETLMLLLALRKRRRNRTWIGGPSGAGKTQLVINVLRKLNYPFYRLQLHPHTERSDLLGRLRSVNRNTVFFKSQLVKALEFGAAVLYDEYDTQPPECAGLLRPLHEDSPALYLEETNELIIPAEGYRGIATGNTFGQGDESGQFRSASKMSVPDRERWPIKIKVTWLPPDKELRVVKSEFPDLSDQEAELFIKVANLVRAMHDKGQIEEPLSTRGVLSWIDIFLSIGSATRAAEFAFLNGFTSAAQAISVRKTVQLHFPDPQPAGTGLAPTGTGSP